MSEDGIVHNGDGDFSSSSPSYLSQNSGTNKKPIKIKKHPDAPKRFKSAFIFFSTEKHREIRKNKTIESEVKTTSVAKMVSAAWKSLSPEERSTWDVKAQNDRTRYEYEKARYKGPWKDISAGGKKAKNKDPLKPKRPMSTFLAFSTANRESVRKQFPEKKNSEISVILGEMWAEVPQNERQIYIDEEQKLREVYKVSIAKWRAKVAKDKEAKRQFREKRALQMALAQKNGMKVDTDTEARDASQHPFSDVFDTSQSGFPSASAPGMTSYHPTYGYPQLIPSFSTGLSLPPGEGYVNSNEQGNNMSMPYHNNNSMVQGIYASSQVQVESYPHQFIDQENQIASNHEWTHAKNDVFVQVPYHRIAWQYDESTRQLQNQPQVEQENKKNQFSAQNFSEQNVAQWRHRRLPDQHFKM